MYLGDSLILLSHSMKIDISIFILFFCLGLPWIVFADTVGNNNLTVNINPSERDRLGSHSHEKEDNRFEHENGPDDKSVPLDLPTVESISSYSGLEDWTERKALKNAGRKVLDTVVDKAADQLADKINNSVTAAINGVSGSGNDRTDGLPALKRVVQNDDACAFRCNKCDYKSNVFLKVKGQKNMVKCPQCGSTQALN